VLAVLTLADGAWVRSVVWTFFAIVFAVLTATNYRRTSQT
jgi:hypothetical protein